MVETTTVEASVTASSYRVKFNREQFLELIQIARPRIVYRRKNVYFFAFDGFVMFSDQCEQNDFSTTIIDAIEFSNYQWAK